MTRLNKQTIMAAQIQNAAVSGNSVGEGAGSEENKEK